MPFYEVKLTALCVCVVEADDACEALKVADEATFMDDYVPIESEVEHTELVGQALESSIRHADKVLRK